jgi:hypothetical protein
MEDEEGGLEITVKDPHPDRGKNALEISKGSPVRASKATHPSEASETS